MTFHGEPDVSLLLLSDLTFLIRCRTFFTRLTVDTDTTGPVFIPGSPTVTVDKTKYAHSIVGVHAQTFQALRKRFTPNDEAIKFGKNASEEAF